MPNLISDIGATYLLASSIRPQTIASATTTNGVAVDLLKCDDVVSALVQTGDCGDSTLTLDVKIQEAKEDPASAGNPLASDWSDMVGQTTATAAITQLTGATNADNKVVAVTSRRRTKRFARVVVITGGGGTLSVPICATLLSRLKISGTGVGYVTLGGVNT